MAMALGDDYELMSVLVQYLQVNDCVVCICVLNSTMPCQLFKCFISYSLSIVLVTVTVLSICFFNSKKCAKMVSKYLLPKSYHKEDKYEKR